MPTTLVTGASRGIGAAVARACARAGQDLVLNFQSKAAEASALADELRGLGRQVLVCQADISDEAAVAAMFARIDEEAPGPLTALVNNAGIVAPGARLAEMDAARWRRVFEVNVIGTLLCAREAARRMSTKNGGAGGAIVNMSSRAAQLGSPGLYVDYAASKGAVDTLTIGLARELIVEGIRVNGVRPGIIDTEIHADAASPELLRAGVSAIPMQRMGTAQEVAEAVLWLLSPAASYAVGTTIDVTGGR